MTENSVVRARIDERTKKEAAAVLAAMGMTLSDAFRLLVKRIAAEKALPFARLVRNEKTHLRRHARSPIGQVAAVQEREGSAAGNWT